MNLKRLFNKGIIVNNLKRFWWVSLLYVLGLFLVSPLIVLTRMNSEYVREISFDTIFTGTLPFLFIVPVFLAVMVFRYMQNKTAMVTMHSMPYTRLDLYVNNIISGLILLVTPIFINTALLSYISLFVTNGIVFDAGIVLHYLAVSLLVGVTLFSITVAVGMVTGSSIAQIIFTYILNGLPAGLFVLTSFILTNVVYGFSSINDTTIEWLAKLSPIVQAVYFISREAVIDNFVVIDIIMTISLFIIGYLLYRYRNLEDATEVISGKVARPIFKYGVTVCTMLVGVAYVKGIFNVDNPNLIIYLAFALLGYCISEMLLRKSFKILNSYKGFVGYIGVFAIIVACIYFDVFGYEKFVPNAEDVKCFTINSYYELARYADFGEMASVLFEKNNIDKIIKINQDIVDNKEANKNFDNTIRISYLLKDGNIIDREYRIDYDKYKEMISEIRNSSEYKKASLRIFSVDSKNIENIKVSNSLFTSKYAVIFEKGEVDEMLRIIKDDILTFGYDAYDRVNNGNPVYNIEVHFKNYRPDRDDYYITIENLWIGENLVNVCKAVEEIAPIVIVDADDIRSIEIHNLNGKGDIDIITNKEKIDELLEIMKGNKESDGEMDLLVNFNDGINEWRYVY